MRKVLTVKEHKYLWTIGIFIILMLTMHGNIAYAAETANPTDELLPKIENLYNYQENKYFKEYKNNYYLDLKDTGVFKGLGGRISNMIANLVFGLQMILTQILIIVVYYSFELSIFDLFKEPINLIIGNLKNSIFDEFVLICIGFLGIYYIVKVVKNQRTKIWVAVLQTIAVLVIGLSFFRAPAAMLEGVDQISKSIGQAALEGTYKATMKDNPESATEAISTNLWVMFVHKPWQIFEFGNTQYAEKNEDKILTLVPESDARQKIIDEMAKDDIHFQSSVGLPRLGLSLVYIIIFALLAAMIFLLCFLMIGYQVLMMILALMGPLILLIAVIPGFGFNTIKSWASKVIAYGSMKAVLSLTIAIVFSFMLSAYQLSDKYGLLIVALIQVAIIGIVWVKRDELIDGFFKFVSAAKQPTPQNINRSIRRDTNIENGVRNWSRRHGKDYADETQEDQNGQGSQAKGKVRYDKEYSNYKNEANRNMDQFDYDNINNINNNLTDLRRIAEEILEEKYNKSKTMAEDKAELTNQDPEYSNWTKTVMSREKMNLPKFEEREKQAVVNQIKEVQAMGGNIEDIIQEDGQEKTYIRRPENLTPEPVKMNITERGKVVISDKEASKNFVNTFNDEFDKNYNESFMNSLVTNYGQESVGEVVDNMVRINKQSEIKNPTGYLLKSLNTNREQINKPEKLDLKVEESNSINEANHVNNEMGHEVSHANLESNNASTIFNSRSQEPTPKISNLKINNKTEPKEYKEHKKTNTVNPVNSLDLKYSGDGESVDETKKKEEENK